MDFSFRNMFSRKSEPVLETRDQIPLVGDPFVTLNFQSGTIEPNGPPITIDPTQISAVLTCTNIRASMLASMPIMLYRKGKKNYNEPLPDHPYSKMFNTTPFFGNEISTFDFMHYNSLNYDLQGNAFAQIIRNTAGRVVELIPLAAQQVSIRRTMVDQPIPETGEIAPAGTLLYFVTTMGTTDMPSPTPLILSPKQILHVRNYSTNLLNGLIGQSVLTLARESIVNVVAEMNLSSRRVAQNTLKATSVISAPGNLTKEMVESLKDSIEKQNRRGSLVLTNGMQFVDRKVMISPEDAQFLQSYSFKLTEIASMFGIPAKFLGITSDRTPAAGIEMEMASFLTMTMRPICIRWEQAMNLRILSPEEQQLYTFGFDDTQLNRLDSKAQMAFLSSAIQSGILTINEARETMGYPSVDGGDDLRTPLNMGNTGGSDNTNGNQKPNSI